MARRPLPLERLHAIQVHLTSRELRSSSTAINGNQWPSPGGSSGRRTSGAAYGRSTRGACCSWPHAPIAVQTTAAAQCTARTTPPLTPPPTLPLTPPLTPSLAPPREMMRPLQPLAFCSARAHCYIWPLMAVKMAVKMAVGCQVCWASTADDPPSTHAQVRQVRQVPSTADDPPSTLARTFAQVRQVRQVRHDSLRHGVARHARCRGSSPGTWCAGPPASLSGSHIQRSAVVIKS